jgi:GTP cyclohydrolase I
VVTPLTTSNISPHVALESVRFLLKHIGENPDRDGLQRTPQRVVDAWTEMTAGYDVDIYKLLAVQFDQADTPYGGIVLLRAIPFASLCEHHILPFVGTADVAYIPGNGRIVGLSKLARLVDAYARRLQVQERMTVQIVEALEEHLQPKASACIVRADHTCMTIRGVAKTSGGMVTSELRGAFKDDARARAELMHLLG